MSTINHYTVKIMAEQRQRDLWAEAANHRLAASAKADRSNWWRRLLPTRPAPASTRPASSGVVQAAQRTAASGVTGSGQPIPC
jgi:hypothetical protein